MRLLPGATIAAGFALFALSTAAWGACNSADITCEPSNEDAREKMQRLLDLAYATPHTIASFEKLAGRSVETKSGKVYEMRILVVVDYKDDQLRCRVHLCPELHNYQVDIDSRNKTAKIAGWLFFKQTSQGWR